MFSLYLQNGPWNIVQNQHCIQLVFANCLKPAPNCTASSLCMSSWEYTWEYISLMGTHLEWVWGIQLEHTWTCGIHLEHIWNTLGTHLEYTWNTLGIHSEYTWNTLFSRHSCFFGFGAQVAGMDGEYSWNTSLNLWKNFRFWRTHLGYLFLGKWMSFYIWHTHRTWAGKEPFWNTLRSTFWTYKQHTLGTQKKHFGHFQCMAAVGGCNSKKSKHPKLARHIPNTLWKQHIMMKHKQLLGGFKRTYTQI